jgi:regulator of sigma E protease
MITILLGLIGLSIVVIVHEFGHFVVAQSLGVEVEAFSIGWGPSLFKHKGKKTEWRIGVLPIGGYCKLKGEDGFRAALDQKLDFIPADKGSFYSAHPLKRIAIAVAGPTFNMIFAVLVFVAVVAIGTTIQTAPNRIVLSSEAGAMVQGDGSNPADAAGLKSGDFIQAIDGRTIRDYSDLQEVVASNPGKALSVEVLRDGAAQNLVMTPRLDPNSGAGVIGVYAWVDPVISSVKDTSPAAIADLRPGDTITEVNGKAIRNTVDLMEAFKSANGPVNLTVMRDARAVSTTLVSKSLEEAGIGFVGVIRTDKASSLPDALSKGFKETISTFSLTIKSIGLLFRGVNVFKAVSGPARITYLIGTAASEQIKADGLAGLVPVFSFLAFLSVSLAIMNLLPLPVLDGGLILVFIIELFRKKPLTAKSLYRYQFIGAAFVLVLFVVATMSDIFFFAGK